MASSNSNSDPSPSYRPRRTRTRNSNSVVALAAGFQQAPLNLRIIGCYPAVTRANPASRLWLRSGVWGLGCLEMGVPPEEQHDDVGCRKTKNLVHEISVEFSKIRKTRFYQQPMGGGVAVHHGWRCSRMQVDEAGGSLSESSARMNPGAARGWIPRRSATLL